MSELTDSLTTQIQWGGLDIGMEPEYRFAAPRRWKFDLAWPARRIAAEVEGGTFARKGAKRCKACGQTPTGRHSTGVGLENDCEKYNRAAQLGWRVFRFTGAMVRDGRAFAMLQDVIIPF